METEGVHETDGRAPTGYVGKVPLAETGQIAQSGGLQIQVESRSGLNRHWASVWLAKISDVEISDVELTVGEIFWKLRFCKIEDLGNLVLEI